MKKKYIIAAIALLLAVTAVVAAIHLANQKPVECMVILRGEQEIFVSFEDLGQDAFSGELINGKGDVTAHTYTGILLKDLLEKKGIDLSAVTGITVTSADNYSVEFTAEEVLRSDKVYAALTADGKQIEGIDPGTDGVQVIVFGDPNSRRCVRFAQKITVE